MYPKEMILACNSHKNGICRKKKAKKGLLCAEKTKPTLLELEKPEVFEFYDCFDVPEFTYTSSEGKGHFKIQISLQQTWNDIEIEAQIVNMEQEIILMEIPVQKAQHTHELIVEKDFQVEVNGADTKIGIIAFGKWGNNTPEENELAVCKEANTAETEYTYIHHYPKLESETVRLGNIENPTGKTGKVTDKEHIVIALIREPKDLKDVDYLCGAGRYGNRNHPVLCVPGKGIVRFPSEHRAESDDSHKNRATCKLYRKQGGTAVIATTEAYAIDNCITISPMDNQYQYEFLAWKNNDHGTPYDDPAGWKKTEFDYHLELILYTTTYEGGEKIWHRHKVVVCSNGASEVKIPSLQIMYGCVAPDTKIRMGNGVEKAIQSIRIGDIVMGKDNVRMEVENVWKGPEMEPMIEITTEDEKNRIFATKSHPMWVKTDGGTEVWKRAKDCCMGDSLLIEGKGYCPIGAIAQKPACEIVYNLDLKPLDVENGEGTMYCNGILTGDNRRQNGL